MSGHTPGPWSLQRRTVFGSDHQMICMGGNADGALGARQLADMTLTAAAPDLLAALLNAKEWLHECGVGSAHLYDQIDSAISKATGVPHA